MTDDDLDRIATCIRVLAERTPLMNDIFNDSCRESLSMMLASKVEEEKEQQRVGIYYEFLPQDNAGVCRCHIS